jgi:hypothetical protein
MSLSPHEERVAAEIEEELRARDLTWSRVVDELSDELDRGDVPSGTPAYPRFIVAVACLAGGLVALYASLHAWLRVKISLASGLPSASVRIALVVTAGAAIVAAVLFVVRAAHLRRRHGPIRSVPNATSSKTTL